MLNKLLLRMRTRNFDDLYLKIDQKVVRLWPDQPDRLLRPWTHGNTLTIPRALLWCLHPKSNLDLTRFWYCQWDRCSVCPFLPSATYSFFKHLVFMFTPYYSQSSLVQLLGSWAPNPRVVGSIPWPGPCCCDLKQVTLSLLLQRTCASAVWLHGLSLYNYSTSIRCCNYNITPTSNPESLHYYAVCILYLIYSW